jgi:hypothetical protein
MTYAVDIAWSNETQTVGGLSRAQALAYADYVNRTFATAKAIVRREGGMAR